MYKKYTLKEYKCKQVSPRKGHIKYLLEDEMGHQRTVSAMAKLGYIKKIKSIHPICFRETPLIEALAKAKVNDTIEIDFSDFNKRHPRLTNEESTPSGNIYKELKEHHGLTFDAVSFNPFRILQLFVIALLGLALILGFKSLY